jgi:glycosyltransferase involved in cell wall biosynthesis
MKVLLCSPGMDVGGAERVVLQLTEGLAQRGHHVAVSGAAGPLDAELGRLEAERIVLPERGRSPAGAVGAALRLAKAIKRLAPDVVHGHNVKAAVTAATGARIAGVRGRAALVATFHGVGAREQRASAWLLRGVDAVACVSADLADKLLTAGYPRERVTVIHNAVSIPAPLDAQTRAALDAELRLDARPVVLAVGRLVEQKNHLRLLDAVAEARARGLEARFLIAGDGPLRGALEARRDDLGVDCVSFLGVRPDVRALMARCDLTVFSSDWEGLSIAALESLAAGTPIVSTPVEGMSGLLHDAGIVSTDSSPAALAACIIDALADERRRSAMGAAGQSLVAAQFSLEQMVAAYEHLYVTARTGAGR